MGPFFLQGLAMTVMLVLVLGDNSCVRGEYDYEGECCPKCASGKVVKTHCTKVTSTVCIPCVDNTYMDHPNGELKCLRCKTCDTGAGLIKTKKCTYTSNTECGCEDGSFCPAVDSTECDMCQKHKKCQAGERVKSYGTKLKDTECEKCRAETFSHETMTDCAPWTKCLVGERILINGNSIHDTICTNLGKRNRYCIAGSFAVISISVIVLFVCGLLYAKKLKENPKTPQQEAEEPQQDVKEPQQEAEEPQQDVKEPQQDTRYADLEHSPAGDHQVDYLGNRLPRDTQVDSATSRTSWPRNLTSGGRLYPVISLPRSDP